MFIRRFLRLLHATPAANDKTDLQQIQEALKPTRERATAKRQPRLERRPADRGDGRAGSTSHGEPAVRGGPLS